MRDTTEAHIARGGNVAFFSGNTSLWQVRLEGQDEQGRATQLVGWKGRFRHDPHYGTDPPAEVTPLRSDLLPGRHQNHRPRGPYHRGQPEDRPVGQSGVHT